MRLTSCTLKISLKETWNLLDYLKILEGFSKEMQALGIRSKAFYVMSYGMIYSINYFKNRYIPTDHRSKDQ